MTQHNFVTNDFSLLTAMVGDKTRKVAHNTTIRYNEGLYCFEVVYHWSVVVRIWNDNSASFYNNGWQTPTTKERLNWYAHLFLGTHKDNMHDMISKHREDHSKSAKGERNGRTQRKLTNEIVYKIRELIEQGYTQQEIAETFGVSAMTISYIKSKKTWKWLK